MVEVTRFRDGVVEYANAKILPKLTPGKQFAAGMAIGIAASKAEPMAKELAKNEIVKASGLIAENGMIDVDMLYDAAVNQLKRQKTLTLDVPMIGRLAFDENDIADLYRTIIAM